MAGGLGGGGCITSHTPRSTATHHIPPLLPVVNPEGEECGGIRHSTEGRIGGAWRGAFTFQYRHTPHSTLAGALPPSRATPPAEGKEYGGIRWYRRVMVGSVGCGKRRDQVRGRRGVSVGGGGGGVGAEASAVVAGQS